MSDEPERTTEEVEAEVWQGLDEARRSLLDACVAGEGSGALREVADALLRPMEILERERGRRQLTNLRYATASD